jgi:hypothetical protein
MSGTDNSTGIDRSATLLSPISVDENETHPEVAI